jgi:hypothetical protein
MQVYLAQVPFGNYYITAVAETEKKAIDIVYKEYKKHALQNGMECPKRNASLGFEIDLACHDLQFNQVEWL